MVLLDFSMTPLGKGESVSPYVARCLEVVAGTGLDYRLHAMVGTTVEESAPLSRQESPRRSNHYHFHVAAKRLLSTSCSGTARVFDLASFVGHNLLPKLPTKQHLPWQKRSSASQSFRASEFPIPAY
jgi:hypothetical protein